MVNKQARENFKALLRGKPPRSKPTLAEAKARLRAADPAIDISRPLRHLSRGDVKQATVTLAAETLATVSLPYIRPVVTTAIDVLLTGKNRQLK
jgi:hypothetical protein